MKGYGEKGKKKLFQRLCKCFVIKSCEGVFKKVLNKGSKGHL